ncbi:MAG: polyprenyl diphosphate synthase [Candidatus Colwellbacteria bacterium]|nr:polyprenyl diphosphate synthase [Candidatus Colwellbacteria bacterium]
MHLAIIPDGNRRWAKKEGFLSENGHKAGADNMKKIIFSAWDAGVTDLTIWGLSLSNVKNRSKKEIFFLYKIFSDCFSELVSSEQVKGRQVKIKFLGEWKKYFPDNLVSLLSSVEKETSFNEGANLTFMLAYSGKEEMISAINLLIKDNEGKIGEKELKRHLMTNGMPPVDLVIRTGGEPHWSDGFMMWDVADAHFYFTEVLWPDFSKEELLKAIRRFNKTERRFGK